jgi:hypothetical protein
MISLGENSVPLGCTGCGPGCTAGGPGGADWTGCAGARTAPATAADNPSNTDPRAIVRISTRMKAPIRADFDKPLFTKAPDYDAFWLTGHCTAAAICTRFPYWGFQATPAVIVPARRGSQAEAHPGVIRRVTRGFGEQSILAA